MLTDNSFSIHAIQEQIYKEIETRKKAVLRTLIYVGKEAVNKARSSHKYIDQTGNLTSSIGFVVLDDGVVVSKSSFPTVKKGSKGKRDGTNFLKSLIAENKKGMVLIVVAGMNYASYVEAMGLDVLISAELYAEQKIPELLRQLGFAS